MKRIFVLVMFIVLVFFAGENLIKTKNAVDLCIKSIIPALFPFFVLSNLVIDLGVSRDIAYVLKPITKRAFGIGEGVVALVLGLIGGYPIGAKVAISLYEKNIINKQECIRILAFCVNSGPAFIIGIAGSIIFKSTYIGIILYIIHIISAFSLGIILNYIKPIYILDNSFQTQPKNINFLQCFVSSIKSAMMSVINVSAFVIFFSIVIGSIKNPILIGVVELGSGLNALALSDFSYYVKFIAVSFLMAFGSFSVHAQAISFIANTDISPKHYILGKIYHSIIAVFISILFIIFKII